MSTVRISQYTGNISASNVTVTQTGSFQRIITTTISASTGEFDAGTIFIGGTSFSKTELDDIKAGKSLNTSQLEIGGVTFTKDELINIKSGKSISTTSSKQVVHESDPSTFVQMKSTVPGRVRHLVSNIALFDMTTGSFVIGAPTNGPGVPLTLQGSTISITGSTSNTGSFEQSGSFNVEGDTSLSGSFESTGSFAVEGDTSISGALDITGSVVNMSVASANITCGSGGGFSVNNLLDLLENFGNTGIPTGSDGFGNDLPGGGVGAGDINLDGQVNIADLLLLLSGYGNPATICSDITIAPNVNSQLVGPEITISSSVVVTVSDTATLRVF